MQNHSSLLLDVRTIYAADAHRTGAHFIRRHRIRLLKETPTQREPVLLGTAIVEVAYLELFLQNPFVNAEDVFRADLEWESIGALLFNSQTNHFHPEIESKFPVLRSKKNLAFIRHIRLQPEHREKGWGRELVRLLKSHFKIDCGILITFSEGSPKPAGLAHPLLPDHWEHNEPYPQGRLLRGIHEAGFSNLNNTELFIAELDV